MQYDRFLAEGRLSKIHDVIIKKGELFNKSLQAQTYVESKVVDKPRYRVVMAPKT